MHNGPSHEGMLVRQPLVPALEIRFADFQRTINKKTGPQAELTPKS